MKNKFKGIYIYNNKDINKLTYVRDKLVRAGYEMVDTWIVPFGIFPDHLIAYRGKVIYTNKKGIELFKEAVSKEIGLKQAHQIPILKEDQLFPFLWISLINSADDSGQIFIYEPIPRLTKEDPEILSFYQVALDTRYIFDSELSYDAQYLLYRKLSSEEILKYFVYRKTTSEYLEVIFESKYDEANYNKKD